MFVAPFKTRDRITIYIRCLNYETEFSPPNKIERGHYSRSAQQDIEGNQ